MWALTAGGDLSLTTDYIFRGISLTDGHGAAQLDLHAETDGATFAGVFVSSLGEVHGHGWDYELETYLGHRFDLSTSWNVTLSAVNYAYLGGDVKGSNNYQEVSVAISWLDRATLSFGYAPNIVRYDMFYRLGRYATYIADLSAQLPIVGRLFATAGIGHYSLNGPEPLGYFYGNAGLAFEYKGLRIDAGYYAVDRRAQDLFPWGEARDRLAATVSWHF